MKSAQRDGTIASAPSLRARQARVGGGGATAAPAMPWWRRPARHLPADDHTCGWLATAPPAPPPRPLEEDVEADAAIIGAGFTGLAIARRLAELRPGWKIVVLDAQRAGEGASGRSSGFVVDLVDFVMRFEPSLRDRYVAVAREGIDTLRQLVDDAGIDCHWDDTGWIRAAAGEAGERFLSGWPRLLDEMEMPYERLSARRLEEITGSRFYQTGLRLTGYPLVHSGRLVRGLVSTLPAAVDLHEETPVTEIRRQRSFELATPRATVRARRLFLATNGYSSALGFLRQRIFPLYTFGSLTRELTPREQRILGGEREWGILAMDPMGSSVRRTRDQRILIRNTVRYSNRLEGSTPVRGEMRGYHRQALVARFPELYGVELEHTWGGLMGTSYSQRHWFGQIEDGLYASAGYTGAGIAMGTASGRYLAELALGETSDALDLLLGLPEPNWMPPEPLRSVGGWMMATRMNARAGTHL